MFPEVVGHMEEGAEVLAGPLPIRPEAGAVMEAAVESFREEVSCGRKDFILVNTVLYVLAVWYHDRIWLSISKRPPKNINGLYGYRTAMSMKNQATWTFAHHYAGKIWFYSGIASLSLSLVVLFLFCCTSCFETVLTILMFVQLILLVGVILPTERALRRNFDSLGNLKEKTKAKEKSKPGNHTGF